MKRVVIIGAEGLVGTHFSQQYASQYELIPLRKKDSLDQLSDEADVILFLAQSADYKSPAFTKDLLFVNVELLRNALEKFSGQAKQFIYFSSGSVYESSSQPLFEHDPLFVQTDNPYIASKIMGEMLVNTFAKKFDSLNIIRPFFIYGKNQNQNMLFSRLISQIKNDQEIMIGQSGGLLFNPIYVKDVIKFISGIIEAPDVGLSRQNIFGPETTILEKIVGLIATALNKKAKISLQNWPLNKLVAASTEKKYASQYNVSQGIIDMLMDKN